LASIVENKSVFINGLGRLDFAVEMSLAIWLCKIRFTANSIVQNLFWVNTVDTKNTFALLALSSYSNAVKQIPRMFVNTCVVGYRLLVAIRCMIAWCLYMLF